MKKQIKIFILIITLILIVYVPISYAIEGSSDMEEQNDMSTNTQEQSKLEFFAVDSKEKQIGSTLNMYINLSEINYDISKFTLTSSTTLDDINAEVIQNSNGIEIEKEENNEFSLIINKNELNIEQIILTYIISDNFKVGDKFILTGKISEYKEENIEDNLNNSQLNEENNVQEIQIEIMIVEKQENEKNVDDLMENQNNEQNKEDAYEQVQKNMQTTVKNNMANYSSTQTVVYNGSRNNYLGSLSVTNYELNTEFTKENTTYFLTVSNDVTSIKITATKEESSSTVCIYGNDDLEVGTNKVLISVTAENGDVRNYRIFVTREL